MYRRICNWTSEVAGATGRSKENRAADTYYRSWRALWGITGSAPSKWSIPRANWTLVMKLVSTLKESGPKGCQSYYFSSLVILCEEGI